MKEAFKRVLFALYRRLGIASRRELSDMHTQDIQRIDAALRGLHDAAAKSDASHADWQRQIGELVQAVMHKASQHDLQRQVAQLVDRIEAAVVTQAGTPDAGTLHTSVATSQSSTGLGPAHAATSAAMTSSLAQAFYRDLERQFRGTVTQIRDKQMVYRPWIAGLTALWPHADRPPRVADLGCGGGEWLALLREWGMDPIGIDSNALNIRDAQAHGFRAEQADAADWLAAQPAGSLAAVTAFHLAEHLPMESLLQLLAAARRALMPQGLIIIETPNPENLLVATQGFWLDPTHQRPLPPALLAFMVSYSGFHVEQTLRLNPPDSLPWEPPAGASSDASALAAAASLASQPERDMFVQMVSVGRDVAVIGRTAAVRESGAA